MRVSFIFVIILILILFLGIRGHRMGLLGILFRAISWIFTLLFVALAGPALGTVLSNNTGIADAVYEHFVAGRSRSLQGAVISALAEGLTTVVMRVIGVLFAVCIALVIIYIVRYLLKDALRDDGFVGRTSRLLGTLWGLLEGVLISWIILAFCSLVLEGSVGGELYSDIHENVLLDFLYGINPLRGLFP